MNTNTAQPVLKWLVPMFVINYSVLIKAVKYKGFMAWGYRSKVKWLPSIHKAVVTNPSTTTHNFVWLGLHNCRCSFNISPYRNMLFVASISTNFLCCLIFPFVNSWMYWPSPFFASFKVHTTVPCAQIEWMSSCLHQLQNIFNSWTSSFLCSPTRITHVDIRTLLIFLLMFPLLSVML